MAVSIRKQNDSVVYALAAELSAFRKEKAAADSKVHASITATLGGSFIAPTQTSEAVASANSSSLGTSITLGNEIKSVYNRHLLDSGAHKAASTLISTADASDLATGITLGNAIKAAYEIHRASTTYHYTADATNTIAASDATDQSSLNTLLSELKTDINAHMLLAFTSFSFRLVDP